MRHKDIFAQTIVASIEPYIQATVSSQTVP